MKLETIPTAVVIAAIGISQMAADVLWDGTPSRMGALGMVYAGLAGLIFIYAMVCEIIGARRSRGVTLPKSEGKTSEKGTPSRLDRLASGIFIASEAPYATDEPTVSVDTPGKKRTLFRRKEVTVPKRAA